MSLSTFKDFNKSVLDIFNDDFDYKYGLKVKASAPRGVTLTVNTDYSPKGGKAALLGKVSAKWAHESGFAIDKVEMKSDGSLLTETSLTGVAPGLTFEFKGDDSSRGDLGLTYKTSLATATAEVDVVNFSKVSATVNAGKGPFTVGASAGVKLGDNVSLSSLDVSGSYLLNNKLFAGVKTGNKFNSFDLSLKYDTCSNCSLAALFNYQPEKAVTSVAIGGSYKCNPNTILKGKANSDGILSFSVKQTVEPKCTLVGAVEADTRDLSLFKLGVTATLG